MTRLVVREQAGLFDLPEDTIAEERLGAHTLVVEKKWHASTETSSRSAALYER